MKSGSEIVERFHHLIDDETESRACKDIDDKFCKVVPGNYLATTLALVLGRLADKNSKALMALTALLSTLVCLLAAVTVVWVSGNTYLSIAAFFLF